MTAAADVRSRERRRGGQKRWSPAALFNFRCIHNFTDAKDFHFSRLAAERCSWNWLNLMLSQCFSLLTRHSNEIGTHFDCHTEIEVELPQFRETKWSLKVLL
ncbi:hypothetical protein SEVIR_1G110300v4 [Setaria viridis]|uniref:Uncharacterized protein n=1 Tax=Setaria viridis TaxID=4556 RepID=A0A4U6W8W1_SETVI|nr:hypothetical protein SEVIR_1G110300v2 [Setaria viridis]